MYKKSVSALKNADFCLNGACDVPYACSPHVWAAAALPRALSLARLGARVL